MSTLGNWIIEKYRTQAAFAEELGIQQSRVSKWLSGREPIPEPFQKKIGVMKYKGPWPQDEAHEIQAASTGSSAPCVTREEFEDVPGRLKRLEEDSRAVLPLIRLVEDLGERVKQLEKRLGPAE